MVEDQRPMQSTINGHPDNPDERNVSRRLRPLYVATFFQSFVLWYAVEKFFMHDIGFNDSQIAIAGILLSVGMIVAQTPTGILADRWSRKGVLILASVILIASTLIGALSHNVNMYYVCEFLWGIFTATASGIRDSIVYDVLVEDMGDASRFEHYFGRVQLFASVGFVPGSLLGGVLGGVIGLRANYWISIPLIGISIISLIRFREPTVHRKQPRVSVTKHAAQTLQAFGQSGSFFWIVLLAVLFGMMSRLLVYFGPVWYLGFALPVVLWGPAYAFTELSGGIAGAMSSAIKNQRYGPFFVAGFMCALSLTLTSRASIIAVVVAQTVVLSSYGVLVIFLSRHLHDGLPSHLRAGVSSTVGTVSQLAFLPTAYLFGRISNVHSIFGGAWLVVAITTVSVVIFCIKIIPLDRVVTRDEGVIEPQPYPVSSATGRGLGQPLISPIRPRRSISWRRRGGPR
jgi:MFS family permease